MLYVCVRDVLFAVCIVTRSARVDNRHTLERFS